MYRSTQSIWLWLAFGVPFAGAPAALVAIDLGGSPTLVDFSGFTGAGFAPAPGAGQLDSGDWAIAGFSDGDLAFGGTAIAGDFARGSSGGGVTTGGVYAFAVGAGDPSFGVQPTGTDFAPGTITLRLRNATGFPIDRLDIQFEVWVLNNGGYSTSMEFSHSPDNVNYVAVPAAGFETPEVADGSPAWVGSQVPLTLVGLDIPIDDFYYLRWSSDDVSGTGARDEIGLDDIAIVALPALFIDGFESGDSSAWSDTEPPLT